MFCVSTPHRSPAVRRITATVLPIIPNSQGWRIYGFSVNFLRFPRFFGSGVRVQNRGYSFLSITTRLRGIGIEPNILTPFTLSLSKGSLVLKRSKGRAGFDSDPSGASPNGAGLNPYRNGGSLNARNLRECSFAPSRRSSLQASMPIRICSLIARS
jgi:hypothetical protein